MIKAEWRYMLQHKFLIVALCVVVLIPSIYAVTFLKSMWDPYGKLADLPVAVVNQDHAVTYQHRRLAVGKQLTQNLKKSQNMDFQIVKSADQAHRGLKNGQYYMVVTIPAYFSAHATTLLDQHPQQMVLHYDTSAGHNYVAAKMTSAAATKIQTQINREITRTYAKSLFASIKKLDRGMQSAGNGSQKVTNEIVKLQTGSQTMTTNLAKLAQSSLTLATGSRQVTTGIQQYVGGVQQAQAGTGQLVTGLDQLLAKTAQLQTGSEQLRNGAASLKSGVNQYVGAATQLDTGTQQLNTGVQNLNTNVTSLSQNIGQLNQGTATLTTGLQQLANRSQTLSTAIQQLATNQGQSMTTTQKQLTQLSQELAQLNDQSQQVQQVKTALTKLQAAVTTLNQQQSQSTSLAQRVAQTADAQQLTVSQKQAMVAVVSDNQQSTTDTTAITSAMAALNVAINDLTATATVNTTAVTANIAQIKQSQNTMAQQLNQLATGATNLNDGLSTAAQRMQTVHTGTTTLAQTIPTLIAGIGQLADGSQTLATKTHQFAQSGTQLSSGAQKLSASMTGLTAKLPAFVNGVGQLTTGSHTLASGLTQLVTQGGRLLTGAQQVSVGNQTLASGAGQLATGSQTLGAGITQLGQGSAQLTTSLQSAARKAHLTTNAQTNRQVASPVKTTHTELDRVANNGTGMAPYMVSVSLFVGALALNLLFDLYSPRKYPKTAWSWMISKFSIWGPFAVGDALIVYGLLCGIDGLNPVHQAATLGIMMLSALSSMALVTWLNLVFGRIGAFFSMVLLVLQLSGSAGTYPIQLSNHFFKMIHPYLPMTYSVNGLRKTLMIGSSAIPEATILTAILVGLLILILLFYSRRHARLKAIDFDDPDAVKATQGRLTSRMQ